MVSLFTKYIAKKKLISINSAGANEDSQNRSVAGDGGGHNYFQWEGDKFPHQEEQMKIPKIGEDSQKRWEAEEGGGVSGAQGQLDDAVGIFRFRDRLMLTQKKKVNSMEWTATVTIQKM